MRASRQSVRSSMILEASTHPGSENTAVAELQAGIGWESIRFYQAFNVRFHQLYRFRAAAIISWGTSEAASVTTFTGHFFVRPEAHLYIIKNNQEFSSPYATRVGISLGYTFAPGF